MAKNPIVLELFWNEELNGGKIEDVVQCIDFGEYHWNCYNCGNVYKSTIMDFLSKLEMANFSQFNTKCNSCIVGRGLRDSIINTYYSTFSEKLKEVVDREYSVSHREQEVITICPICGEYHSVKMRSIRRMHSFVCKDCIKRYSNSGIEEYKSMSKWVIGMQDYWGKNKYSYEETIPVLSKQSFNIVCPECGKSFNKALDSILKTGFYCKDCARINSRISNIGSLRDNYPEVAEMWDNGGNSISSDKILPSSTIEGRFMCNYGGKEHYFVRPLSVIIASYKKGYSGCPVCNNKEVYSGVNDFATRFPMEVENWDYDNNENKPEESLVTNVTKFALICPRCGKHHTKRTDAIERNGSLCAECSHSMSSVENYGSLKDLYPEVAEMWDNGGNSIGSDKIPIGSSISGNFCCRGERFGGKKHIFIKPVSAMVAANRNGTLGCPVCAGFELRRGINDFKSVCPNIAELWDYEANDKRPEDVYYREEKSYKFICPEGHPYSRDLLHLVRAEERGTTGCPVCAGREVIKGVNDVESLYPDMLKYWCEDLNEISPSEVTPGSNKLVKIKCRVCGKVYETTVFNWCHGYVVACEDCRKRQFSIAEKELCETIKSWGFMVEENVELTGDSRTYDMYLPELDIAIEYNGLYFHSDAVRKDTNFHLDKYLDCYENGIQLIQIWEDDYLNKKEIVLRFLKNKLGVSKDRKVNARECTVCELEVQDAREFLNRNHIQGFVSGSRYIGLKDNNGILVAVMVLEKYSDTYDINLKRYATSCNVRGGFSKLLYHIKDYIRECSGVYTFSDNTISSGELYRENGFRVISSIKPDYMYVVGNRRVHKFNYRKDRFRRDENLLYAEDLTESELARLNGLARVYDAGKIKWFKEI